MTHWLLILSLPLLSIYIAQPPACKLDSHPGCTNSSNLPTWTPTGLRLSHLPLLIFLKLIDFIMLISYWPVHPPALMWCLQSASPQLWEIFKKIWHKCHMWRLISQKVPLRSLLLCCTHAHSSSPSTYSNQPFPFHTLQPVYVYGTIKLAPWGAESPSQWCGEYRRGWRKEDKGIEKGSVCSYRD